MIVRFFNATGQPLTRRQIEHAIRSIEVRVNGSTIVCDTPHQLLWSYRCIHGWQRYASWQRGAVPITGLTYRFHCQLTDAWELVVNNGDHPDTLQLDHACVLYLET